uniref:SH3 and cysteine rich domain n=1 Tax=Astyanax mexicanus TaxID=7994 RepID=A0A8B9REX5_ASTMX
MAGVVHNAGCFMEAVSGVDDYLLSCSCCRVLRSYCDVTVPKTDSNAGAEDALYSPSVEHNEHGRWEMCFPQSLQEVEESGDVLVKTLSLSLLLLYCLCPNAKLGLRCKACKMGIHHKCLDGVGQQRCMGKLPKGFRRYSSSPLLIQEQFGCIKEVMPIACGSKVDPVYETLRFGTSLAQKTKRMSGSDSPPRNSSNDLAQVPEEAAAYSSHAQLTRKHSDNVFASLENGTENFEVEEKKPENSPTQADEKVAVFDLQSERELRKDLLQLNTYVALYRFTPQDNQDLEMRPGDRIILADDSNDDWWKGVIDDRIGFFPASFAHQVKAGERVFRCNRTFIGCKEQGQITLKEGQICISNEDEHNGFIRVASGKKRGFVPCDVLENI